MGAMQQIRTPRCPIVALPASKEVLLEIQVNNLINKVLFSSAAEDCQSPSISEWHGPSKENALRLCCQSPFISESHGPSFKENALRLMACDTFSGSSIAADNGDNVASQRCRNADGKSGERFSSGSLEVRMCVKACHGYREPSSEKQVALEDPSVPCCSLEGGSATKTDVGTQLIRTGTFPCKWEMQSRPCDMGSETKHSCRKPPRPPRPPRSSGDGSRPKLARCVSDTSILLQATRRTRMERRRKMAAAVSSSSSASLWALLFTVCFAVVMLAPGLWSESTERVAGVGSNSPSRPFNHHTRLSVVAGSIMEANAMAARSKDSLHFGHNKVESGRLPSLVKNKPGGEFAYGMPSKSKPSALKPLVSRGALRKLRGHLMSL